MHVLLGHEKSYDLRLHSKAEELAAVMRKIEIEA